MTQRYIGGLIYNPPGGYSGYFNGSSSLSISSSNTVLPTGTQDFCVEMWFSWQTQSGSYPQLISNPTTNGFQIYYDVASGLFAVGIFNVSNVITYTISQTALSGGWNHLAVTRSGNTFRLFLNGILQANGTNTISFASVTTQYIGSDGSRPYTGYLSNVRTVLGAIPTPYQTSSTTNGTAVFTPPNGALQAITSTALLTCAFATFRDGSTNNYTITINSATVSTQNPFPLTTLPNPAQGNAGNGIFSMSQYQSLKQQNLWPAIDPYFDYTTLLLHGNGTNGAQNNTFLDSSTNNFTITRNGNTTQGTFTPYGSNWGNYFNGSTDYLSISGGVTNVGTGDFCLELWTFFTGSYGTYTVIWESRTTGGGYTDGFSLNLDTSGNWCFGFTVLDIQSSIKIAQNQWQHVCATRQSGTIRLFVNGVLAGTLSSSNNLTSTTNYVGRNWNNTYYYTGYTSNLRAIKSSVPAAYQTSSTTVGATIFTPPTGPLTAITNTSLLTCQSNRFIDNSSNAFAITVTGSPSVQRFSPFNPSAPYAAGTIGGSGYFDGTGDSLTAPSGACISGTGDFTAECWIFPTTVPGSYNIIGCSDSSNGLTMFGLNANGTIFYGRSGASVQGTTSNSLNYNTWNHIAISRSSSTLKMFINGVQGFSGTETYSYASGAVRIGTDSGGSSLPYTGYISNFRIIQGSAIYTTGFTPPTAPLTAVSGTSLLLNFTNGGIIDNAMMNDLETVGNAQISTTQSKFGGASLYFDGTGDYLSAADSPNFYFGSGDWTIEAWLYINTAKNYNGYFGKRQAGNFGLTLQVDSSGNLLISASTTGSSWALAGASLGSGYSTGAWMHVAVTRSGTTITGWRNGTSTGTQTLSGSIFPATGYIATIGSANDTNQEFNGYIDDFRITKGIARYTSNFTPQTSQWQDQ